MLDAIAGKRFEVEISAAWAVGVTKKGPSDARGVETLVAGVASPGTQANCAEREIEHTAAVRSKAIPTATLRANHCERASSDAVRRERLSKSIGAIKS